MKKELIEFRDRYRSQIRFTGSVLILLGGLFIPNELMKEPVIKIILMIGYISIIKAYLIDAKK